jgi:hypothetical protein
MRRIGWGAGLVVLLAGPGTAETVPLEALGRAVGAFVAAELEAPLPLPRLPAIGFADEEAMRALRYGGAAPPPALELVALYDDEGGRIVLPAGWTGATPAEISILVHEMVHHVQAEEGRSYACAGAREAEAYEVQARWLGHFGETLEGAFGIDAMTLLVLGGCLR